jgi:pimeloyl-ACP methyl ester carboxylesterase
MTVDTTSTTHPLAHTDAGIGEPALLFLPGWCGDRTVFDGLLARLAASRRAVAVDLPEHGESPRTGEDFTTSDVVDAAAVLVDTLGIDRVVPVALSHAGWVAIELRRRLGAQRVPGIVLLDWMVLGTPPGFDDALVGLQDDNAWPQVRSALFGLWTEGVDEPAVHEYVASMGEYGAAHWRRAGREISAGFAAAGTPLAALDAIAEPCQTLHLYAQPTDDAVLDAQQRFAGMHPWFEVRRVAARSHFPMFEVPDEMAAQIEQFACRLA